MTRKYSCPTLTWKYLCSFLTRKYSFPISTRKYSFPILTRKYSCSTLIWKYLFSILTRKYSFPISTRKHSLPILTRKYSLLISTRKNWFLISTINKFLIYFLIVIKKKTQNFFPWFFLLKQINLRCNQIMRDKCEINCCISRFAISKWPSRSPRVKKSVEIDINAQFDSFSNYYGKRTNLWLELSILNSRKYL